MRISSSEGSARSRRSRTEAKLGYFGLIASMAFACASIVSSGDATANTSENIAGTQRVYGAIPPDQIEHISTSDRIKSVAASGSMMAIWETLEHGERVECLDCIPVIEPLLYDANPRTREIAAWWLRRRIFGVFGKGQVYERTVRTLESDTDPVRRMYAANALGEFLALPGIDACAAALERDSDPTVRAAAASALGRLNDTGNGALAKALSDVDSRVKLAALRSASRLNAFTDVSAVARLSGDGDPIVRRNAAELIGHLRAPEGVDSLLALAKDPDANVRNAACHSLGALHDQRARGVLEDLANNDPNTLVRDQARIALRRL
ncbi:MAG: HEAT repeat domain-containing protein [Myxococcales bacterium]|nr:HEAT repeat domain-containing protein [Myxococcales bacterium]